jgi:predicted nucleic acid-binding protein
MILVDTNMILRYLVQPPASEFDAQAMAARDLFAAAERNEAQITTTEIVVHEVAFVLASKRQYGRPVDEIVTAMTNVIRLPGMRLPRGDKRRYLTALDLWARYPSIGFADALIVITAQARGAQLATFDKKIRRIPNISLWQPPAGS